jgi:hypothetical protein
MIMFHLCPDRYTSYKKITTTTWGPMKRKSSSPLWVGRKSTHTHTPGRWRRRSHGITHGECFYLFLFQRREKHFFIPSCVCDVDFSWGIPRPDKVERVSR